MQSIKLKLYSILFILCFITPHIFISIAPSSYTPFIYFILIFFYTLFAIFIKRDDWKNATWGSLLLTSSFLFFGLINQVIKSNFSFANILLPAVSLLGFIWLRKREIDTRVFRYLLLISYVYFYFVYFSIIPDLFLRPGFDEDEIVFENSSSNAIPMALNMILYSFLILNRFYLNNRNKEIYLFSIVNLLLSVIQQSRVGILVAFVIMLISSFILNKKLFHIKIILVLALWFEFSGLIDFIELVIGKISSTDALEEDIRGEAINSFFQNMDSFKFIFGYPKNFIFASSPYTDLIYTYNVFIDMWNRYGVFHISLFTIIMLYRFYNFNKYLFPLFYIFPFLIYSIFESIFFPNFWDCLIYLLMFTPPNKNNV
jgi:hypothetical protein